MKNNIQNIITNRINEDVADLDVASEWEFIFNGDLMFCSYNDRDYLISILEELDIDFKIFNKIWFKILQIKIFLLSLNYINTKKNNYYEKNRL